MMIRAFSAAVLVAGAANAQQYEAYDDDDSEWAQLPVPPPGDAQYALEVQDAPPQVAPTQLTFERTLSPYGEWLDVPGLGRVWRPSVQQVGADFVPYDTGGSWYSTPQGWVFRSQFSWGWAAFHYGRWHRTPSYGWVWWPSYTWGPSWVDWRCDRAGTVAWAPMAPPNVQVSFRFRHHRPHVAYFPYSWGGSTVVRSGHTWRHHGGGWRHRAWDHGGHDFGRGHHGFGRGHHGDWDDGRRYDGRGGFGRHGHPSYGGGQYHPAAPVNAGMTQGHRRHR
jgi:hypothetical protein